MSVRITSTSRLVIDGRAYKVRLIDNPLIDDVLITEAQLLAAEIESGSVPEDRRVSRDIRDFFIRLGVER